MCRAWHCHNEGGAMSGCIMQVLQDDISIGLASLSIVMPQRMQYKKNTFIIKRKNVSFALQRSSLNSFFSHGELVSVH
jgi:hypothetical protein